MDAQERRRRLELIESSCVKHSAAELGRRFGVHPRTIHRDRKLLREIRGPGHRLDSAELQYDATAGPLSLERRELVELCLTLAELRSQRPASRSAVAESVADKLLASLPPPLRTFISTALNVLKLERAGADLPKGVIETLSLLLAARHARRAVRVHYRDIKGKVLPAKFRVSDISQCAEGWMVCGRSPSGHRLVTVPLENILDVRECND